MACIVCFNLWELLQLCLQLTTNALLQLTKKALLQLTTKALLQLTKKALLQLTMKQQAYYWLEKALLTY